MPPIRVEPPAATTIARRWAAGRLEPAHAIGGQSRRGCAKIIRPATVWSTR
jgi:hypothetical protein